jgi:hypothetical protein
VADQVRTPDRLVEGLGLALLRLGLISDADELRAFLEDLGWDVPATLAGVGLDAAIIDQLDAALDGVAELQMLPPGQGDPPVLERYGALFTVVAALAVHLVDVASRLGDHLDAAFLAASNIIAELPRRLIDYLIIEQLREASESIFQTLFTLGIFELRDIEADPATFTSTHTRRIVRYDRLGMLLADPPALARDVYGWGDPGADLGTFLQRLHDLAVLLDLPAGLEYPFVEKAALLASPGAPATDPDVTEPELRVPIFRAGDVGAEIETGITIWPVPAEVQGGAPGLGIVSYATGELGASLPLGEEQLWALEFESDRDLRGGIGVILRPGRSPMFLTDVLGSGATASGSFQLLIRREAPADEPITILSVPGGSGLFARSIYLGGGAAVGWATGVEGLLRLGVTGGMLVVTAAEADGFLSSLLPPSGFTVDFDLGLLLSTITGLHLDGSAALETAIPVHSEIGPISIDTVYLALAIAGEGLSLEVSLSAGATLGPLAIVVDRIGVRSLLAFQQGNLGPVDLRFGFKFPSGLGLAIDAGPVSGGGYLFFDPPNGRYAGILQLSIYSVSVTAIGLLDTRDSGGQPLPAPGFSFLIIISAEFPPIQLGYGFTLNGVGGLAGIHRTVVTEALQSGIRNGTVDHILFPDDPIRQAPQIISDLRTIFPAQANRFVFGPMALLGWGSPTLIELELGIILEVPAPIRLILLGQLNLVLPDKDAPVVELHIDILGILDFGRRLISIDATLRDSRVAAFNISGDMALRLSWGEKANFAASVGGLNPHFQPPADFPTLRRAMISFGFEDNPRIGVQTYMAVTSNSVQFGARAELFYEAGGFNIYGWLIFDALVIFRPLFFRFDFSQGFALRRGDDPFLALHVTGTLTGPRPYHIWGEGCISILFWDLCIGFDVQFGERQTVEFPQQDVWPLLAGAIADVRNWSATLPQDVHVAVSLRQPPASQVPILVHPMGSATLRQRVIPLNRTLDKYGEFRISGANRFEIDSVAVGDEPAASWSAVTDLFAPGQFEELSDAEKLSRDSFESMVAGVSVASRHIEHGAAQVRSVMYETVIVDSPWDSRTVQPYSISLDEQVARSQCGAKANSLLARSGTARYAPAFGSSPPFTFDDDEYVIVDTTDLSIQPEFGRARSKGELYRGLRDHVAAHPEDSDRYQVAALSELGSQ